MSKRKPDNQADLDLPMPEGVHLRIPDVAYFDAAALGSSDLKALYWGGESWWYSSWLNASRRIKLKSARKAHFDIGTALHDLVLLGEEAFQERFITQPDEDSPGWIRNPVELKDALEALGRNVRGMYGEKLYQEARRAGIANRVWDLAWANFEYGKRQGRSWLSEADETRVRYTAKLLMDHAQLGPAMRENGLSEVAVFWRRDDDPQTLLRAKFDRLRYQRAYDLKSLGNWRGRDIDGAIADAIDQNDYGIQRRFYMEAWDRLVEFVTDGKVYGWAPDGQMARVMNADRATLTRIAQGGIPEWIWIFVQLRNDAYGQERAPAISPRWHKPQGRIWDEAGVKIEAALETFRRLRSEFGLNKPWALIEEAKELVDADVRSRLKREIN